MQAGEVRPSDLTEACFEQMERSSWLNCFVTRCFESARSQAEAADARQANGERRQPDDATENVEAVSWLRFEITPSLA